MQTSPDAPIFSLLAQVAPNYLDKVLCVPMCGEFIGGKWDGFPYCGVAVPEHVSEVFSDDAEAQISPVRIVDTKTTVLEVQEIYEQQPVILGTHFSEFSIYLALGPASEDLENIAHNYNGYETELE